MLVREYSKLFLAASNAYSLYHDAVGTQTQNIYCPERIFVLLGGISQLCSELEFTCGLRWLVSIILLVFFARWEMFTLSQGSTNVYLFAEDILYFSLMFLDPTFLFLFSDASVVSLQSLNLELSNSQRGDCGLVRISFSWHWLHECEFLSILRTCTTRTSRTSVEGGLRSNSKAWGMVAC